MAGVEGGDHGSMPSLAGRCIAATVRVLQSREAPRNWLPVDIGIDDHRHHSEEDDVVEDEDELEYGSDATDCTNNTQGHRMTIGDLPEDVRSKIWDLLVDAESLNDFTFAHFYSGSIGTFRWGSVSRFVTLHGSNATPRDQEGDEDSKIHEESSEDTEKKDAVGSNSVRFDWLVACLSRCSRLGVIDFNGCTFLQDDHLISILAPHLGKSSNRRKSHGNRNKNEKKKGDSKSQTEPDPVESDLRVLGLRDCALLTTRSLRLIQRLEELDQLDLGGVACVDDNLLMQVLHGKKQKKKNCSAATISSLSLRGCHSVGQTPGAIRTLVAGMPRLRSIDLSQISKLSGLLPSRSATKDRAFANLTTLSLIGSPLNEEILEQIVHCENLQILELTQSKTLSTTQLTGKLLASDSRLINSLRSLYLEELRDFDEHALKRIARCTVLEELRLHECFIKEGLGTFRSEEEREAYLERKQKREEEREALAKKRQDKKIQRDKARASANQELESSTESQANAGTSQGQGVPAKSTTQQVQHKTKTQKALEWETRRKFYRSRRRQRVLSKRAVRKLRKPKAEERGKRQDEPEPIVEEDESDSDQETEDNNQEEEEEETKSESGESDDEEGETLRKNDKPECNVHMVRLELIACKGLECGLRPWLQMLQQFPNLTELDLTDSLLDENHGTERIEDSFQALVLKDIAHHFTSLTDLNLGKCYMLHVFPPHWPYPANYLSNLRRLILSEVACYSSSNLTIREALLTLFSKAQLTELDFRFHRELYFSSGYEALFTPTETEKIAPLVALKGSLRVLRLRHLEIHSSTISFVDAISALTNLETLELSELSISYAGFKYRQPPPKPFLEQLAAALPFSVKEVVCSSWSRDDVNCFKSELRDRNRHNDVRIFWWQGELWRTVCNPRPRKWKRGGGSCP